MITSIKLCTFRPNFITFPIFKIKESGFFLSFFLSFFSHVECGLVAHVLLLSLIPDLYFSIKTPSGDLTLL